MILARVLTYRRATLAAMVLALALILLVATAAIAGNMHFNSGGVKIGSVIFNGIVVGIGNGAVEVEATANAIVTLECTNKGGTAAPGRNLLEIEVSASGTFPADENGRAVIEGLTVFDPTLGAIQPSPTPKQAGCPNGNWNVSDVIDVFWTTVSVAAKDANGVTQDELFFDCTGLTNLGDVCPEVSG